MTRTEGEIFQGALYAMRISSQLVLSRVVRME